MLCTSTQVSIPTFRDFVQLANSFASVWVALEAEGLGANLQHYNSLIDQRVAAEWKLDETNWSLKAQMVFGKPTGQAGEKSFFPLEDRVKVFSS
jgi:uncharacterized protein